MKEQMQVIAISGYILEEMERSKAYILLTLKLYQYSRLEVF